MIDKKLSWIICCLFFILSSYQSLYGAKKCSVGSENEFFPIGVENPSRQADLTKIFMPYNSYFIDYHTSTKDFVIQFLDYYLKLLADCSDYRTTDPSDISKHFSANIRKHLFFLISKKDDFIKDVNELKQYKNQGKDSFFKIKIYEIIAKYLYPTSVDNAEFNFSDVKINNEYNQDYMSFKQEAFKVSYEMKSFFETNMNISDAVVASFETQFSSTSRKIRVLKNDSFFSYLPDEATNFINTKNQGLKIIKGSSYTIHNLYFSQFIQNILEENLIEYASGKEHVKYEIKTHPFPTIAKMKEYYKKVSLLGNLSIPGHSRLVMTNVFKKNDESWRHDYRERAINGYLAMLTQLLLYHSYNTDSRVFYLEQTRLELYTYMYKTIVSLDQGEKDFAEDPSVLAIEIRVKTPMIFDILNLIKEDASVSKIIQSDYFSKFYSEIELNDRLYDQIKESPLLSIFGPVDLKVALYNVMPLWDFNYMYRDLIIGPTAASRFEILKLAGQNFVNGIKRAKISQVDSDDAKAEVFKTLLKEWYKNVNSVLAPILSRSPSVAPESILTGSDQCKAHLVYPYSAQFKFLSAILSVK